VRYLSVCSGVEAATVAWHGLGWQPVAFSEIEKFPSEVLTHHYPAVPNLGDMTKYKEWNLDTVQLLVGGTPCQSFSVAGLRKGMDDPRGNLALVYCGILDHYRPKWFIWENVPGVLSSNRGQDFGAFLGALVELGYGFSYRVLDAQYWGLAQRRKRVFVVGHLGDWRPTAAVLFESKSLSRDITPSREKKQTNPTEFVPSVANCLETTCNDYSRADGFNMIAFSPSHYTRGFGQQPSSDLIGTLKREYNDNSPHVCISTNPVAVDIYNQSLNGNLTTTLTAACGGSTTSGPKVMQNMAVRRLTPVECERLQGFPDNYTNIKDKCPDGPRYKAMGNSMAVPVMRWIGKRIQMVENNEL
jgi:DNA (cytosine-5)-methyltransferase 1